MEEAPKEDLPMVDLGGDLALIVGQDDSQIRIQVSKAHLSFASSYFKTLLGPRFMEGSAAEAGKALVLKDDDPEAFTVLMKILHMRHDLKTPMAADELLALAVVADKYGFTQALKLPSKALFPNLIKPSYREVFDLTSAAYLFGHSSLFYEFTKTLLLDFCPEKVDRNGFATLSLSAPSAVWRTYMHRWISHAKVKLDFERLTRS
ncbi:btb poz [Lecanosticta acicola]|uniref:Btb poz n=1 Tax=Lecanosticta acicola TaxID=111012 RepID=A0AAI8YSE0_9PEZI|nr:btb poz [Lecanosticta acicola]